jgi:hypothetical protein
MHILRMAVGAEDHDRTFGEAAGGRRLRATKLFLIGLIAALEQRA